VAVASAGLYASLHLIPDNHANIRPLSFLQAGCPSCHPTNSVKALKANNNLRKYSFCSRVVNIWNSLPNKVVEVDTINSFKNRLDKYWTNEEVFL